MLQLSNGLDEAEEVEDEEAIVRPAVNLDVFVVVVDEEETVEDENLAAVVE